MANSGTVVGYFSSQETAESTISALKEAGFHQSQIGVAARSASAAPASSSVVSESGTSTAYKTGQSVGGAWETVKHFFTGNTAEPYAGETTKETFNDRVVTPEGYGSDDLHGSLAGLSVPAEHARYFGHRLTTGVERAIVTVNAPGREVEAAGIIEANGGDIGNAAGEYDYGTSTPPVTDAQHIQLYGEVLRVHKDRVGQGEVRIRKEVHTTPQSVEVPVTREELVVERVPISGQEVAGNPTFEGQEIRIPLSEERAYVEKQAVVREEVRIGKKEVTNVESFDEKVRSEELKVDQNGQIVDKTA
jgi:uncharacterized protein (TIGR02271 family)